MKALRGLRGALLHAGQFVGLSLGWFVFFAGATALWVEEIGRPGRRRERHLWSVRERRGRMTP